jgi:zinc protease
MKKAAFFLIPLVLVSCTTEKTVPTKDSQVNVSSETKDSVVSSSSNSSEGFVLKKYTEEHLPNGLTLLMIPDHSLPRISLEMMIKAGSAQDPKGKEGLNALTADVLDQGTTKRSAEQLSDEFNELGTELTQSASYDFTMVQVSGLSPTKDQLLDLYADVVLHPAFSETEVNRNKSQTIAAIKRIIDQPTAYADILLSREVFGGHPYSHNVHGSIASVSKLTRNDLLSQYKKYYRPNNSILAVTGDFDDQFIGKLKKVFSTWPAGTIAPNPQSKIQISNSGEFKLITKPDLSQTQIRWGQVGLQRNDPDFLKMRLAFLVLGGGFASRLMQHVRDDKGLTYSISAASETRLTSGLLEISTFTRNDKAKETIEETKKVIQDFSQKGITEKELADAKALLVGQFPAALETTDRLASNLMLLRLYGVSDDYLHSFHKLIANTTVDQVNEAIRKHFSPDKMVLVVYADQKAVEPQLKKIGSLKIEKAASN